MSKLEELIQQYCPDGVEYRPLGEVTQICRGVRVVKSELSDTGYPVFQNCLSPMGYYDKTNCPAETTYIICAGAAGDVGYTDEECWAADDCQYVKCGDNIINKYVYYCLMSQQHQLLSQVRKASIPRLSPNIIKSLFIPVPPLPVQEEIVRILDCFTIYTTELETELEGRRKQYDFYRSQLLSFDSDSDSVQWKSLGEVATVLRGKRLTKSELAEDKPYPVYHGGLEPLGYYGEHNRPANMAMVINVGASAGTVGFCKKPFWSSDGCYCIQCSSCLIDKYVYYALCCRTQELKSRVRVAGIPTLDRPVVENLIIPVPSLSEQQRIVDILDRFDAICNDLTQGLPAEIEARKQQYEYYRDKLLTFKKKD